MKIFNNGRIQMTGLKSETMGTEAIQLRRKYPALQKAWDRYLTVWHLIHENDSDV